MMMRMAVEDKRQDLFPFVAMFVSLAFVVVFVAVVPSTFPGWFVIVWVQSCLISLFDITKRISISGSGNHLRCRCNNWTNHKVSVVVEEVHIVKPRV